MLITPILPQPIGLGEVIRVGIHSRSSVQELNFQPVPFVRVRQPLDPMENDRRHFRSLAGIPARLTVEQTAAILGFQVHDMQTLMSAGLLRPLGQPARNSTKYFAAVELEALWSDVKCLAKATNVIQAHWREKNGTAPIPSGKSQNGNH